MCAFWLEIVSVCVLWGEIFLRAPPSADIYDIFTVPAFFDAPIGSMTGYAHGIYIKLTCGDKFGSQK